MRQATAQTPLGDVNAFYSCFFKHWWSRALIIVCYALLLPTAYAATPAGTIINNTATVNYQINLINQSAENSNTDSFTVLDPINSNQGNITTLGINANNLYLGSTTEFDILLTNDGINSLEDGVLSISLAEDLNFSLNNPNAILQSQETLNGFTTYYYNIDPLLLGNSATYTAQLGIPLNANVNLNELTINYQANAVTIDNISSPLNLNTRTQGVLQLMQYSPASDATPLVINTTEFKQTDGVYATIPAPVLDELGVVVTSTPIPVKPATNFSNNQIIFIQLNEGDHNTNNTLKETIEIDLDIDNNGEIEQLRLTETDVDSGIFTGYITLNNDGSNAPNNGVLNVNENTVVNVNYTDDIDNTDATTSIILVDPFGILFDSATGALLNGYTVSMINSDTGAPAQIFGDDGISSYPSTVITGSSVTDSGGTVYNFTDGAYRFPFAPLGNYHLQVTRPNGSDYIWPSQQPTALINQLPNAPYAITLGSRGETFPLQAGPPLHIDIPLDRLTSPLYVLRKSNVRTVAAGDFIHFTITVENTDSVSINNVVLTDTLPQGFRLEPNSILINKQTGSVSTVSSDGQTFTFNLNNFNANEIITLEYVVAVGTAKPGTAQSSSSAIANNGAITSNTAHVNTWVAEDLMRSRAILMGQVIIENLSPPPESTQIDTKPGLKGVRIYMEDGRYAITDDNGMYHFENIMPGSHVVQLDLDTLPEQYEAVLTQDNTRFSGRAWSQFIDVQGGTLWRSDFHVSQKPKPQGNVSLQIQNSALLENDTIQYTITLKNGNIPLSNTRLTIMIPEFMHYQNNSSTLNERAITAPEITRNMLTFRLNDLNKNATKTLRFTLEGIGGGEKITTSELISKAFMVFNTPAKNNQRTPVITHTNTLAITQEIQKITDKIELDIQFDSADDKINNRDKQTLAAFANKAKPLQNLRIHAVGHSDNRKLLPKTKLRFKDNYQLSASRATVIANELKTLLKLPPSHITIEGKGPEQPITDNSTPKARKENRRVTLYVYRDKTLNQGNPNSIQAHQSAPLIVPTQGVHNTQKSTATQAVTPIKASPTHAQASDFNKQWLAQQQSSKIKWLYPAPTTLPELASTRIAIQHLIGQKVRLLLEGLPVEKLNFEGTITHPKGGTISAWKGVDLKQGDNLFEAIIYDQQDNEIKRLKQNIHFSTEPVKAKIVKAQSTLVADGITHPVIAIRLLDKDGYPVRNNTKGSFRVNPPYKAKQSKNFNFSIMPEALTDLHDYHVTQDGIALITLEPTTESGDLTLSLPFTNSTTTTLTTKLNAQSTPWILVGLAEGTVGYQTLTDNSVSLNEKSSQNDLYQDNRVAFFAKGKIAGKWLMTIAYDSAKNNPKETDPELFQTIDPSAYYTIYGDTAYNGYAAPSSEKLYLKLEHDQFYFLFGDYQTAFNDTKLAQYNRTFTGIKARYNNERYDVIVFGSNTSQAFQKDEFQGNGLTGPYQLTRNNIAMNSEKLIIEVRDRLRSEVIVSTTELSRHQDYQIDYQTGVITFRQPVLSTDSAMNPQYIIVKYESFDAGDTNQIYGARAKVAVNEQLTLGLSHLSEGQTDREARLEGLDATYQLTKHTKITLEAAQSNSHNTAGKAIQGNSYLAEITHQTERSNSKLYVRDQAQDFGIGQTNASENGLQKIGIETQVKASENITLKGLAYQQKNTESNLSRNVIEAEGKTTFGKTDLRAGVRTVQDQQTDGLSEKSQQITAGVSHRFMDNKLTTSLHREQNVNSDDSIDFPNRTRLGVNYRVTPKTSLFIEQDITDSALKNTSNTLVGIKSSPWQGGEIYSGMTQTTGSEESQTRGNVSVRQAWQLTDQWRLDAGIEDVSLLNSSKPSTSSTTTGSTPFANSANKEFTAGSFGITFHPKNWMWSARIESRKSKSEEIWRLATSLQTNPNNRFSTLSTLASSNTKQSNGSLEKEAAIRLGFAYRPLLTHNEGRWMLLNKLDLKWSDFNSDLSNTQAGNNWRIINNFNANYTADRWQLSLQYAAKSVNETLNNKEYNSFTDLVGIETRYDINNKWDVGLHGNILRSAKLNQYDYNTGVSVGRTVANNIWVSLGYNFTGFYDDDFSRSRNTNEGAFLRFRIKFDQSTVQDAVQWVGR